MAKTRPCISCGQLSDTGDLICSRCRVAAPAKEKVSRPKKILLIDDEPGIVTVLTKRLESEKYTVVAAADGIEGYAKVEKEKPDLIILDVLMPGMTGYEFVQKLKREGAGLKDIPVLIITGRDSMEDFFHPWDIVGRLGKPIDSEKLLQTIRRVLGA